MSSTPYSVTGGNYQNIGGPQQIGVATSSLFATHGSTPVDQSAGAAAVSTSAAVAISSGYGFSTQAQADAIVTAVNAVRACLVEKGLMASS